MTGGGLWSLAMTILPVFARSSLLRRGNSPHRLCEEICKIDEAIYTKGLYTCTMDCFTSFAMTEEGYTETIDSRAPLWSLAMTGGELQSLTMAGGFVARNDVELKEKG